jgi:sucrose-phosphate synthase
MDRYDLYGKLAIPKTHSSETDVPELYRIAAERHGVFVNTAFIELFGLTAIESSATGLPFVATQSGGPQDIVENCESGLLVDVTDHKQLKLKMLSRRQHDQFLEFLADTTISRAGFHGIDCAAIPGVGTDFGCLLPMAYGGWRSVPISVEAEEPWRVWAGRKRT